MNFQIPIIYYRGKDNWIGVFEGYRDIIKTTNITPAHGKSHSERRLFTGLVSAVRIL
jgi:hypothetical protein